MDPIQFARRLLGATLTVTGEEGSVAVRITETEAYGGSDDPASHAYRGPRLRNATMFGPPMHLYVYRSYGVHWCANVTCGEDGLPAAVLLRAGEVTGGHGLAEGRRGKVKKQNLARGPGNLAQALGITGEDDGLELTGDGRVRLHLGPDPSPDTISAGPRVGVSKAPDHPWRFWLTGDPTVSAYRRAISR